MGRKIDGRTDGYKDGWIYGWMDEWMKWQKYGRIDGWTKRQTGERTDGWMTGQKYGQMDGWMNRQTDCYKHEPRQTGRGVGDATIYSDILNVTQKTGYRFNSFKILMANVILSYMQNHFDVHFDFDVDKALIVRDFNIHIYNTNDALGLAFTDLINYFGVKQNITGPTHHFNHSLDLIISHGIDLTDIDIVIDAFEWMMHLYSALLCIAVHPKCFTIMWGGGGLFSTTTSVQHPLG